MVGTEKGEEYQLRRHPTNGLFYLVNFNYKTAKETILSEKEQYIHLHTRYIPNSSNTPAPRPLPQKLKDFVIGFNKYFLQHPPQTNVPEKQIYSTAEFTQILEASKKKFTLLPHQKQCLEEMKLKTHCIVDVDMGLGKTPITIAFFLFIEECKKSPIDMPPPLEPKLEPQNPQVQSYQPKKRKKKLTLPEIVSSIEQAAADQAVVEEPVLKKRKKKSPKPFVLCTGVRALVILPAGLISQWINELEIFAPNLTFRKIKNAKTASFQNDVNVIFISVDLVGRSTVDKEDPLKLTIKQKILQSPMFDVLVVDEAHSIKSNTIQRSKAVYSIAAKSKHTFLLTGTPAMEHVHIYGLLRMFHPLFKDFFHYQKFGVSHSLWQTPKKKPFTLEENRKCLEEYKSSAVIFQKEIAEGLMKGLRLQEEKFFFADRYCGPEKKPVKKGNEVWQFKRNSRPQELQALLSPFLVRMRRQDVLNLPPAIREVIIVGALNKSQQKEFADKFAVIEDLREKNTLLANKLLGDLVRMTMQLKTPYVVQYIKLMLEREPKFSCFVHHHFISQGIQDMLTEQKIGFININSTVTQKQRGILINDFKTNPNIKVAILSFGCCSSGFNLTCVNLCLFCERIWEADKQQQSEYRSDRIGQTQTVTLQYLDLQGSTDTLLTRSVQRKVNTQAYLVGDK